MNTPETKPEAAELTEDSALEIVEFTHLWWGVCIGGRHYTGDVRRGRDDKIELTRTLSAKEAKQMNEECDRMWLARERITNKFNTLKSLELAAEKWCHDNIRSDNWMLVCNDAINPNRILAAEGWIKPRTELLNQIARVWELCPNSQREEYYDILYPLWRQFLKP